MVVVVRVVVSDGSRALRRAGRRFDRMVLKGAMFSWGSFEVNEIESVQAQRMTSGILNRTTLNDNGWV
jgi:hypothetical protein